MNKLLLAAMALAFSCVAEKAWAGDASPPVVPAAQIGSSVPVDKPAWLAALAGERLVSVDGSSITLSPLNGGLAVALFSPNGAAQKTSFVLMSDNLGTIADETDAGRMIGFFRETENGLEAQFADGHTESLVANTAGGVSMTIHDSSSAPYCTSWYPPDHVFGEAERRAALAAYADHLGLGQSKTQTKSKKATVAVSACVPAIQSAKANDAPTTLRSSAMPRPASLQRRESGGALTTGSGDAALVPVAVRTSEVHAIDGPLPPAPPSAAAAAPQPAQAMAMPVPVGRGASDCLSVETDGASLGFRNHCAYGVQFAYCLQKANAGDPALGCDVGARTGNVVANGFAVLLPSSNIKSTDADHDFRWVACSGGASDVVAHLDQIEPPAGRCVRSGTS